MPLSVCLSVIPFLLGSHYQIIIITYNIVPYDESSQYAKLQSIVLKVKVTQVKTTQIQSDFAISGRQLKFENIYANETLWEASNNI